MHTTADPTLPSTSNAPCCNRFARSWTSWGTVLAGVTTTIAVQIGLTELCIGLGLMMFEPSDVDSTASGIAIGTTIALLVCALISVFAGAWVAGRMKMHQNSIEAAVHGMLVWAVAGIAALLLSTMAIGILAGGAFSLLGQGLSATAKGLGTAVPQAVEAVTPSWDELKNDITKAIQDQDQDNASKGYDNRFADQSRLWQLLEKSFTNDGASLAAPEEQELTHLIATQLGISQTAARATYEQWQDAWTEGMKRFNEAAAEAKDTLVDAAELAATRTAQVSLVAFLAMIVGLCAAIAGALMGSACARKCSKTHTSYENPNRDY